MIALTEEEFYRLSLQSQNWLVYEQLIQIRRELAVIESKTKVTDGQTTKDRNCLT